MIIKDLENLYRETKHKLRELVQASTPDPAEHELLKRKMAALNELKKYVISGDWTRPASREKFVDLIKSKFDYKLIAKQYSTTRESLDVFVFRQDKRLQDVMGDALNLISIDRIEEGLSSFCANAGIISAKEFDYIVSELLPIGEKKDSLLVSDCAEEVGILRFLLKGNLQKWLNGADSAKLSYLMFLLNTKEAAFQKQRSELIGLLRKKDS